jgi:hypothetical protein
MPRTNFSGVEVGNFEALPAGKYHVKPTEVSLEEAGPNSKNPGSEYYHWTLTIQDGDLAGRKLFYNTSMLPQALFGIKGMLLNSGKFTQEQLDGECEWEPEDLLGVSYIAKVIVKKYNGDDTNDVKYLNPYEDGAVEASAGASRLP